MINPEALDELFADTHSKGPRTAGHTFFTFAGCNVVVDSDGKTVVPLEE